MTGLRARLPFGILARTRLAAVVFAGLSVLGVLPQLGDARLSGAHTVASGVAIFLLLCVVVFSYRRRRPVWGDAVVLPLLTLVAGTGLSNVIATAGLATGVLVAQSMVGSNRAWIVRSLGLMAALPVAISITPDPVQPALTWHSGIVLSLLFEMALTGVLMRGLLVTLTRQDQAARGEAVLVATGSRLLAATDLIEVYRVGRAAGQELADLSPGTVTLVLQPRDPDFVVVWSTGLPEGHPELVLPASAVAVRGDTGVLTARPVLPELPALAEHAPGVKYWRGIDLTTQGVERILVIGGTRPVPDAICDTFLNLNQQVVLAEAICGRRRHEVETRHDQKLESLGRLSAGIAHEINTPIQFVADNTRFLASAYEDMLTLLLVYRSCLDPSAAALPWEERAKKVTDAENVADIDYLAEEVPVAVAQSLEGIERVASLVRAMKSFSYKDSEAHAYADLNAALTTTLTVARNEVKYVADVALDFGELPDVLCCVGDLNQVFLNLLVNAADAMEGREGQGEIRVATRLEDGMAVVTIADNGSGIPEKIQQVIFEPFFTTKEVGKGTGQGLALARVVLEKHGGTIELQSSEGEGTEFTLRLPVDGKRPVAA